jgi:hypothetical protein
MPGARGAAHPADRRRGSYCVAHADRRGALLVRRRRDRRFRPMAADPPACHRSRPAGPSRCGPNSTRGGGHAHRRRGGRAVGTAANRPARRGGVRGRGGGHGSGRVLAKRQGGRGVSRAARGRSSVGRLRWRLHDVHVVLQLTFHARAVDTFLRAVGGRCGGRGSSRPPASPPTRSTWRPRSPRTAVPVPGAVDGAVLDRVHLDRAWQRARRDCQRVAVEHARRGADAAPGGTADADLGWPTNRRVGGAGHRPAAAAVRRRWGYLPLAGDFCGRGSANGCTGTRLSRRRSIAARC